MELTHGWLRVAMIYISGIVLGGLGREMLSEHDKKPLAGASGKKLKDISLFAIIRNIFMKC